MSSQTGSRLQTCSGLLTVEFDPQNGSHHCRCFGAASTSRLEADLNAHHAETRGELGPATMLAYHCLGWSVYQAQEQNQLQQQWRHPAQGAVPPSLPPPPICRGLEYLTYQQRLQQATQAAAGAAKPTTPVAAATSAASAAATSAPTPGASATCSSSGAAAAAAAASAARTASHAPRAAQPVSSAEAEPEHPTWMGGKDPMWFAKAFAVRSAINYAHMKRTARMMWAAAATGGQVESDSE